jgi:septal ring factor EnvC (AmiA/AmiB activator)
MHKLYTQASHLIKNLSLRYLRSIFLQKSQTADTKVTSKKIAELTKELQIEKDNTETLNRQLEAIEEEHELTERQLKVMQYTYNDMIEVYYYYYEITTDIFTETRH